MLLSSLYGVFFIVSLAIDENSNSLYHGDVQSLVSDFFFVQVSLVILGFLVPRHELSRLTLRLPW